MKKVSTSLFALLKLLWETNRHHGTLLKSIITITFIIKFPHEIKANNAITMNMQMFCRIVNNECWIWRMHALMTKQWYYSLQFRGMQSHLLDMQIYLQYRFSNVPIHICQEVKLMSFSCLPTSKNNCDIIKCCCCFVTFWCMIILCIFASFCTNFRLFINI